MWNFTNNNQQQQKTLHNATITDNNQKLNKLSTGLSTSSELTQLSLYLIHSKQLWQHKFHKRFNINNSYPQVSYPHIHRLIHRIDTQYFIDTSSQPIQSIESIPQSTTNLVTTRLVAIAHNFTWHQQPYYISIVQYFTYSRLSLIRPIKNITQ